MLVTESSSYCYASSGHTWDVTSLPSVAIVVCISVSITSSSCHLTLTAQTLTSVSNGEVVERKRMGGIQVGNYMYVAAWRESR